MNYLSNFLEILVHYGVDLSSHEFLDLLTKYDLKDNGRFCYSDFLRHFILNLKPQDEPRSLLARRKIATPKIVVNNLFLSHGDVDFELMAEIKF